MKQLYQSSILVTLLSILFIACNNADLSTELVLTPEEATTPTAAISTPTAQSGILPTKVFTPTTDLSLDPTPFPGFTGADWHTAQPQFATKLYFFSTDGYGYFDFSKTYPDYETVLSGSQQQTLISLPSSPENLGDAATVAFSHFSEQVAYWLSYSDGTAELWLADIDNQNPQLIFHDISGDYGHQPTIIWTPSDKQIILHSVEKDQTDMIYSLVTGQLQEWPWDCNRLALSPQSTQLALWCSSLDNTDNFAVIEWHGDIWFSEDPPQSTLVQRHPNSIVSWGWSPDGDKIAYYDSLDETGALHIVDSEGKLLWQGLPGIAWYPESSAWTFHPLYYHLRPLQWSQDGARLLVYGNRINNSSRDMTVEERNPTYQVVDVERGQILWHIENSATNLLRYEGAEHDIREYSVSTSVFSPDGSQVAIQAASFTHGDRFLAIIDIDEGGATLIKSWFDSLLYWTQE